MSADYRCPYCGAEFEDSEYYKSEPDTDYEVECCDCGRTFEVSYYLRPEFSRGTPGELKSCRGSYPEVKHCVYWDDIDTCCQFPAKSVCGAVFGYAMHSPCPLGHVEGVAS